MKFTTTVRFGPTTNITGIEVPPEIVEQLGSKKPPVVVTVNGFSYRSTVASMGGRFMVGLSKERREAVGVAGGDEVEVDIDLDTAKREFDLGAEGTAAVEADAAAKAAWEKLSYSAQQRLGLPVASAKTDATRDRNIQKLIAALTA